MFGVNGFTKFTAMFATPKGNDVERFWLVHAPISMLVTFEGPCEHGACAINCKVVTPVESPFKVKVGVPVGDDGAVVPLGPEMKLW